MKKKTIIIAIALIAALSIILFVSARAGLKRLASDDFYVWSRVSLRNIGSNGKRLVAVSPSGVDAYAVEEHGGYTYRSTDRGENWVQLDSKPDADLVTALIVDRNNRVFAGTSSGLYRSTDKGATWTRCTKGMWSYIIDAFALDSEGRIYAGGDKNAVYRSDDGGNSWKKIGIGQNIIYDPHINALCITPEGHIFAVAYGSIFKSDDGGKHWINLKLKADYDIIAIFAVDDNQLYISDYSSLYTSDGQGNCDRIDLGSNIIGEKIRCNTVTAAPNGHIIIGTSDGAYISTDKGKSWKKLNTTICGFYRPNIDSISIDSKGRVFAAAGSSVFIGVPK
ncbi:MAG: hypothetical protein ABFD64_01200 [Armatimonadota bacterium]